MSRRTLDPVRPLLKGKAGSAIRSLGRSIVPASWRRQHHKRREAGLVEGWLADWRALRSPAVEAGADESLSPDALLIPSDTRTFSGGKGDEAMTIALIECLREHGVTGTIHALCETEAAFAAAHAQGCVPFKIAQDRDYVTRFDRWLADRRPCFVVGIGADSLDGAYGVVGPAGLLTVLDLAAGRGARALITGFSVRERPDRSLRPFFGTLRNDVRLNVRDPLSRERLRRFYGREGQQVADMAFLLHAQASERIAPLADWVEQRKGEGRTVLAVNIHAMLFAPGEADRMEGLIDDLASAILRIAASRTLAVALVPHDFRPGDADDIALNPLASRLAALGPDLFFDASTEFSAAELKHASSLFDGIVSARMHLAIAALGSGTPVLGIVYQGKFEGLFRLMGLPRSLLLQPSADEQTLRSGIETFIDDLPVLRTQIEEALLRVRKLSRRNFEDGID